MARIWNTPVFILATVYFVVDGVFSHVTRPITLWIAKKKLFERMGLWVTSLRPYPSLALFAVPVVRACKTIGGIFVGNWSFLRGRRHLHYGRSFEAHVRRATVSTK
jgi:hypothetical protein